RGMDAAMSFAEFCQMYCAPEGSAVALDYSRLGMSEGFLSQMEAPMQAAFDAMEKLEAGAIANPDENRMVGHYWLRAVDRIPDAKLREEVRKDFEDVRALVRDVTGGRIKS